VPRHDKIRKLEAVTNSRPVRTLPLTLFSRSSNDRNVVSCCVRGRLDAAWVQNERSAAVMISALGSATLLKVCLPAGSGGSEYSCPHGSSRIQDSHTIAK
jgi:hypothetical protein